MRFALLLLLIAGCSHAGASTATFPPRAKAMKAVAVSAKPADDATPVPDPPKPVPVEEVSLSLPAEVTGKVGAFVKVTAKTNGLHVRWRAIDDGLAVFPGEMLKDSRHTVVSATEAGEYRLLAYTALADIPSDPEICLVRITGPPKPLPPDPPKPPDPPQPPGPVVTFGPIRIAVVDDVLARTPEGSALILDLPFWQGLAARTGYAVEFIDKENPQAVKYKPWSDPAGLPCLVLRDAITGKVRYSGRLPMDRNEISRLVLQFSGK